ncbi:MAG: hypothetical protein IPI98_02685 [Chitinophagaceae bacterium]|nr:hypothetical protein [Chitinophagaceae bacterium]
MSTAAWLIGQLQVLSLTQKWGFHGESDGTAPLKIQEIFCDSANGRWTHIPTTHSNWNSSNGTDSL